MKSFRATMSLLLCIASLVGSAQQRFLKEHGGANEEKLGWSSEVSAGGYIITGSTQSFGAGGNDIFLTRLDAADNVLWQNNYGEAADDYGNYVIETSDQGFLIVGETFNFGLTSGGTILIKTDAVGAVQWSSTYETPVAGNSNGGHAIVEASNGDFVFTGFDNISGNLELVIHRVSSTGTNIWTHIYGGALPEFGRSIVQTSDGGFAVSGYTYSYGVGGADIMLLKVDALGAIQWTKTFGTTVDEEGYELEKIGSDLMMVGSTFSGAGPEEDGVLMRLNSTGGEIWARKYESTDPQYFYSMHQAAIGGFVLGGFSDVPFVADGKARMMKTDINGNLEWVNDYFTSYDYAPAVAMPDSANGWSLARHSSDTVTNFKHIMWMRVDSLGQNCMDSVMTATDSAWTSVAGSPVISTLQVNLLHQTVTVLVNNSQFLTTLQCESCDMPIADWDSTFQGMGTYQFYDSSLFASSWFWTFGDGDSSLLQNPFHTYPDSGTYTVCLIASNGCGGDTLCRDITWTIVGVEEQTLGRVVLYPNPSNGEFNLQQVSPNMQWVVRDAVGRIVRQARGSARVDIGPQPAGVYFLELRDRSSTRTLKLIKQ